MDIIAVVILLVLLGACFIGWQSQRGRSKPMPPGPNIPYLHDPDPGAPLPGQAGFQIKPDPGFNIVSRTNAPPGGATTAPGTAAHTTTTPAGFGQVTQNLTAFCKLTGKRVADCGCIRCTGIKKNRKAV